MADGGYLAPPSQDPSKETIWVETQKRLDRFLPQLFAEIFPPAPEPLSEQTLPSDQSDTHENGKSTTESGHEEGQESTHNVDTNDTPKEDSNDPEQT